MPQPLRRSSRYRQRIRISDVLGASAVTAPPAPSHIRAPHALTSRVTVYYNDNTAGDAPHYAFMKPASETTYNVVGIIGKNEFARFRFSTGTSTPSTISWVFGFSSYNSQALSSMISIAL